MTSALLKSDIRANLARIREQINAAADRVDRDPETIPIVAVTKTVSIDRIRAAVDAGVNILGENRVREAQEKIGLLERPDVSWHFIGHLQSNKAKLAVSLFDVVQSVDSLKLATHLDQLASSREFRLPVLLEVNTSGEPQKHGFVTDELSRAIAELARLPRLQIRGLMTVGPLSTNSDAVRQSFRALRLLRDQLAALTPDASWDTLSMGMSNDFEIAIEEGATMVRLGRVIFGDRP